MHREARLHLHCDGARIWNASVATGVPLERYGQLSDSLSVCFSKGLGAPVGSAVVGPRDLVTRARGYLDLTGPVAFVLGAEGDGMRQLTRKTCDQLVRIPMAGAVESLNVSVASAVCLYEALRQRAKAAV